MNKNYVYENNYNSKDKLLVTNMKNKEGVVENCPHCGEEQKLKYDEFLAYCDCESVWNVLV